MLRPLFRHPARNVPQFVLRAGQRHERRCISFAPPSKKPRTWKGTFARWGIAAGGLYYYTSSDINLFDREANEHGHVGSAILEVPDEAKLPTVDQIAAARRDRQLATLNAAPVSESHSTQTTDSTTGTAKSESIEAGSPEALEEEASSQGAFNEETGEINWDCPCLGGMAHGPCGEQFRDAFSCFVYSTEEVKGADCISKFKTMQDCFREHPDVYGAELIDDEDEEELGETPLDTPGSAPTLLSGASTPVDTDHNRTASPPTTTGTPSAATPKVDATTKGSKPRRKKEDNPKSEPVPKARHEAEVANEK